VGELDLIDVNQQARAPGDRNVAEVLTLPSPPSYVVQTKGPPLAAMDTENNESPPLAEPLPPRSEPGAVTRLKFRERFETLLPTIQREWPDVARHTLEATRGSLDHLVDEISRQTGTASSGVKDQLVDLLHTTTDQAHQVADSLRPLEDQLEGLLDELNTTLRPRIEKPVREKPLMALGIAAGVGLVLGLLLSSGRRSA
jgi:ElaB/YqjD/DUF883 family membrane-anchored ribosome-binding protein